jgi:epoxyqueuosine reductase
MGLIEQGLFGGWLQRAIVELGGHSAACVRMDNPALLRAVEANRALYAAWLAGGYQGEMTYLERMAAEKGDPWRRFPSAKSVLVVAFRNGWGDPEAVHPFPAPGEGAPVGYLSAYAKEADYHHTGQQLLLGLKEWLEDELGHPVQGEAAVDTKPVYERLFAVFGGLGVRGFNELLRVPSRENTRVFLGCLFVDEVLPEVMHQPEMPFSCDSCRMCEQRCPTGVIRPGEPFDARRCISYLTIEKRGLLSREEGTMIGDWIFGCDECTVACPPRSQVDLRIPVDLEWLLQSSAGALRKVLQGSAVAYAGVTQLRRNAVVVLKNSEDARSQALLRWSYENSGSDLIRQQIDLW